MTQTSRFPSPAGRQKNARSNMSVCGTGKQTTSHRLASPQERGTVRRRWKGVASSTAHDQGT